MLLCVLLCCAALPCAPLSFAPSRHVLPRAERGVRSCMFASLAERGSGLEGEEIFSQSLLSQEYYFVKQL